MYNQKEMQFYPDEPKEMYRDYQGEPIFEGDEYVEYENDKVLVSDMNEYARRFLFSSIKVAGDYL